MYCPNCKTTFQHSDKRRKFCSHECYREYRINHPEEYGLKEAIYSCSYCGKENIKRKPSELRNNVYCSRDCANKAQSKFLKNNTDLKFSKGIKIICEYCSKKFYVKPYRAKKARFCSRECSHEHRRNRPFASNPPDMRGEKNPNFRNWSATPSVRKNAKRKLGAHCAICDFDIVVHVHHIIPSSIGGSNDISNLIVLCPNHHEMSDRGLITPEDLINLNPFATVQQLENQPLTHQPTVFERATSHK